jgi:hypothetical protein
VGPLTIEPTNKGERTIQVMDGERPSLVDYKLRRFARPSVRSATAGSIPSHICGLVDGCRIASVA